jgi:O-antigen/teichoic acid export membrane protein
LVWVLTGYFSILDLGTSRATVKFLPAHLARDETEDVCRIVSTAVLVSLIMGVLGGLLLIAFAPVFVERFFRVPEGLQGEARAAFSIVAFGFPAVLVQGALASVPTSLQRFDIINMINGAASSLQWIVAAALIWLGLGLKEVVFAATTIRILSALAYLWFLLRLLPGMRNLLSFYQRTVLSKLLAYGGWITFSQIVVQVLAYTDRLLIGVFLSTSAVTYYSVPCDAVSKLVVIPVSMTLVLFPAFSERAALQGRHALQGLYLQAIKYLFWVMLPMVVILVVFAKEILTLWLGVDFAQRSSVVLQIMTLAFFVNSMAQIPYAAVQALGRPDLTAMFGFVETVAFIALCWALVPAWGINGAAVARWFISGVDLVLLWQAAAKLVGLPPHGRLTMGLIKGLALAAGISIAIVMVRVGVHHVLAQLALVALVLGVYGLMVWLHIVDAGVKAGFMSWASDLWKGVFHHA